MTTEKMTTEITTATPENLNLLTKLKSVMTASQRRDCTTDDEKLFLDKIAALKLIDLKDDDIITILKPKRTRKTKKSKLESVCLLSDSISESSSIIDSGDISLKGTDLISSESYVSPSIPEISEEIKEDTKKEERFRSMEKHYTTINHYFEVETGIYEIIKSNIKKSRNTLLLGQTGTGKTEMVRNISKELDLPLTIFDMGTMSDPISSLIGNHIISSEDGKTASKFVPSRFSEVIQHPGIVLLDELSRANLTANNILFPCLDFRRELPMEYCFNDCDSIKIHPQCVFIATANVGSQYTGTQKIDRALLDRFTSIQIDNLTTIQLVKVLSVYKPALDKEIIKTIVSSYESINKAHEEYKISFNLSIRHLKTVADLVEDGFTIYDSFYVICRGIGGGESTEAIKSILK